MSTDVAAVQRGPEANQERVSAFTRGVSKGKPNMYRSHLSREGGNGKGVRTCQTGMRMRVSVSGCHFGDGRVSEPARYGCGRELDKASRADKRMGARIYQPLISRPSQLWRD